MSAPLVAVEKLKKYFPIRERFFAKVERWIRAVDGVSFHINTRETFGLVGESGCGKTTLARTLLRLVEPTDGKAYFKGKNIYEMSSKELKKLRRKVQIVFQDPFTSLDPRMSIEQIIGEPLIAHGLTRKEERRMAIQDVIEKVGLAREHLRGYPHEFSGGQRQRIAIARALIPRPELLVLDEPTSALDVSVQSQILNLLVDLKEEFDLTCLFISHDLGIVRYLCEKVGVMYLGKIVEMGDAEELFESPKHPYSKALISAIPPLDPEMRRERIVLRGDVPSPANPPPGCSFHPRCTFAEPICAKEEPELIDIGGEYHVACHLISG